MKDDSDYRPHDGRRLPPDEVLYWKCPQCGEWIDEGDAMRTECPVDWRGQIRGRRMWELSTPEAS